MGRIFVDMVKDNIVITRYVSDGFVIPENISQKRRVVAIIESNLDLDKDCTPLPEDRVAVPREDFLTTILGYGEENQVRYFTYGKGLYSMNDMRRGITWAEVAYLLYYIGGLDKVLNWREVKPLSNYNVCVLHEISDGRKILDEKLADYKNRLDMEYYIKLMASGSRYVPLPMYCSFVDLLNHEDSGISLNMGNMFDKVSKKDIEMLLGDKVDTHR